ncbi:MAG: hypothetical protein K9K37_08065 [Desulfocapsa sp.]|nr:hypothetical protein [Desulfocapsa sp.]
MNIKGKPASAALHIFFESGMKQSVSIVVNGASTVCFRFGKVMILMDATAKRSQFNDFAVSLGIEDQDDVCWVSIFSHS